MRPLLLTCLVYCIIANLTLADASTQIERHKEYQSLLQKHASSLGPIGCSQKGEIELITDLELMQRIEQQTGRKIGIYARDKYWIWLNDPVLFPSGTYGVYERMLWTQALEGVAGVCIVPIDAKTGGIYLICQYRHATRSWEIELPRGGCDPGESIWAAALRELKEETGLTAQAMQQMGELAPDTGQTGTVVPIIFCEVNGQGERCPEDTEAIEELLLLSPKECISAFQRGTLSVTIRGKKQLVPMRDPFLAFALMRMGKLSEASD